MERSDKRYVGPKRPTQRVPGYGAEDMNLTGQKSVNGLRLKANAPMPILRMNTTAKPTGGYVHEAQAPQSGKTYSANARRKAMRKLCRMYGVEFVPMG